MKNILVLVGFLFASYSFALDTESNLLVLTNSFNEAQKKAKTACDNCFSNFENDNDSFFEKSSEEKRGLIFSIFKKCSFEGAQAIQIHLATDASFLNVIQELEPQKKGEFVQSCLIFPNPKIMIPAIPQDSLENYITYMKETLDTHSEQVFSQMKKFFGIK